MPRVLVVEDYADAREMYVNFLELNGMEVVQAPDGLTALAHLSAGRPDVVVLDINLPQLDGIEVLRRIRGDPETVNIPVIVVSAGIRDSLTCTPLVTGATLAFAKPLLPEDLLAAVLRVLPAPPGTPA